MAHWLSRSALLASVAAAVSTASCLLTSNFDGLTDATASSSASTGAAPSGTGGTPSAGGSGPGGSSSLGGGGNVDPATGSSAMSSSSTGGDPCSNPTISGAFPSTCVLDKFDRGDSMSLGLDWVVPPGSSYEILGQALVVPAPSMGAVSPGAILWNDVFRANQEVFVTLKQFTIKDFEIELLLKTQSNAEECNGIQVYYHANEMPPVLGATTCSVVAGNSNFDGLNRKDDTTKQEIAVMIPPGSQLGARVTTDGTVTAYVDGAAVVSWDAKGTDWIDQPGHVGIETDTISDELIFENFGGGGK